MATELKLKVRQGNDETIQVVVTSDVAGFTLTGKTLEFFIKDRRDRLDSDLLHTTILTSALNGGVVVDDPIQRQVTVNVPGSALWKGGEMFYRLDVLDVTARKTAIYGVLEVVDT